MHQKTRKLIGTVLLLVFITIYALMVVALSGVVLPQTGGNKLVELLFFVVAGLAWVPVAAWIISWMHREAKDATH